MSQSGGRDSEKTSVTVKIDGVAIDFTVPTSAEEDVLESAKVLNEHIAIAKRTILEGTPERDILALRVVALQLEMQHRRYAKESFALWNQLNQFATDIEKALLDPEVPLKDARS